MCTTFKAAIFDMGGVLFTWNPIVDTQVSLKDLGTIINSETWEQFERGKIKPDDCYHQLGSQIGLPGSEIAATFRQTTACLRPDARMTSLLRELKDQGVVVYMMTNIPAPDFHQLRAMHYKWDLFDGIFASALEGMRKPDLEFYEHVLKRIDTPAAETIFVDDKLENVIAAQAVGMVGLHLTDSLATCMELRQMVGC